MPEKNPHGVRTPGPEPAFRKIPDGSMSARALHRNALQAADPEADPDEILPEAVAEYVSIQHAATGRDDKVPGKL